MTALPITLAPHPIFKQKSQPVAAVDDTVRQLMDDLLDTIHQEHGAGIAAPMVGIAKQVVVIDLYRNNVSEPIFMANPEIISRSEEMQTIEEASLSFLAISADITRPKQVTVRFLGYHNQPQELAAEGFLASCIQHEIDYLHGITFVDHLQPVKRDMLLRKMQKARRNHRPHVHGPGCNHG